MTSFPRTNWSCLFFFLSFFFIQWGKNLRTTRDKKELKKFTNPYFVPKHNTKLVFNITRLGIVFQIHLKMENSVFKQPRAQSSSCSLCQDSQEEYGWETLSLVDFPLGPLVDLVQDKQRTVELRKNNCDSVTWQIERNP